MDSTSKVQKKAATAFDAWLPQGCVRSARGWRQVGVGDRSEPTPSAINGGRVGERGDLSPSADLFDWMMWATDASALSNGFWTMCLWAPDPVWESAVLRFSVRADDICHHDGAGCFERFVHQACLMSMFGKEVPVERYQRLVSTDPWAGHLLFRPSMLDTGLPKTAKLYVALLHERSAGAFGLSSLAARDLDSWLEAEWKNVKKIGPDKQAQATYEQSRWQRNTLDLASALATSGVLASPEGQCVEEKQMAKKVGDALSASEQGRKVLASVWSDVVCLGEAPARALADIWGRPVAKLLIEELSVPVAKFYGHRCSPEQEAEDDVRDAEALMLAHRLGWLGAKGLGASVKRITKANRPSMASAIEAALLGSQTPQPSSGSPRRRI